LVFLDVIFPFQFYLTKSFRNQIAIESTCGNVYCPYTKKNPKKSFISMNNKEKSLFQMATIELYPKKTIKRETARK